MFTYSNKSITCALVTFRDIADINGNRSEKYFSLKNVFNFILLSFNT